MFSFTSILLLRFFSSKVLFHCCLSLILISTLHLSTEVAIISQHRSRNNIRGWVRLVYILICMFSFISVKFSVFLSANLILPNNSCCPLKRQKVSFLFIFLRLFFKIFVYSNDTYKKVRGGRYIQH